MNNRTNSKHIGEGSNWQCGGCEEPWTTWKRAERCCPEKPKCIFCKRVYYEDKICCCNKVEVTIPPEDDDHSFSCPDCVISEEEIKVLKGVANAADEWGPKIPLSEEFLLLNMKTYLGDTAPYEVECAFFRALGFKK